MLSDFLFLSKRCGKGAYIKPTHYSASLRSVEQNFPSIFTPCMQISKCAECSGAKELQHKPAASEQRTTNPLGMPLGQTASAATFGLASTQLAGCSSEAEQ